MDVEDEPNSYLKYLNDSDTPNTYLLGNNEVGLFSVEPIFTEMEATDWPQEGFPLLLTNSLITEDTTDDQDTSSLSSDKNLIEETLSQNNILEQQRENLHGTIENTIDNSIEIQNVIEIQPVQNEVQLGGNDLELDEPNVQLDQDTIQQLDDNCIQLNETDIQLHENTLQLNDRLLLPEQEVGITRCSQFPMKLKPNEKYIIVNQNNINGMKKTLSKNDPTLKSTILPLNQSHHFFTQNKTKSVNDLFSTVVANKCKICKFLCEDLEQIRRHISEKHTEFLFTHNGISTNVSILLSNVKKNTSPSSEVKEEYTVFVCSECHSICIDKNDLKQHMIQVHNLTVENSKTLATEPEEKLEETKSSYKKTSVLSDVTISLVKKQEKSMQQVKCQVSGCSAGFPTKELCTLHMKLHIGETKSHFRCLECDETFQMWRVARIHMYKEHGLDFGMIVCPMCSIFKSYKIAIILRHMVIHSGEKPYVCQECGKAFTQVSQLKNHETLHNKTPEDVPTWARIRKCDKCQRIFANAKSLKGHIQAVHENFKPFICNICGHKTSRKSMLELHTRQHTGRKPHKCDFCEYKAGDPNCLRKHMMKHIGAVSYQCSYCPYTCIQAGSFKNHMLTKHKEKNGTFSCKYCSYTTINPDSIYSHEKKHEAEGANSVSTIPVEADKKNEAEIQTDEETQSCFLNTESQIEETVDNGGITIPAGLETQLVS